MEVRIGVRDVAREVAFESAQTPAEVKATVAEALAGNTLIELEDDKGQLVLVPAAALAYMEIGVHEKGRVGFGGH